MNLDIGSESRFQKFVEDLDDEDKIALISHTDLDGMVAAYVAHTVVGADLVKFVDYEELALPLAQQLKEEGITKIIFTDLYIGNREFVLALEEFAQVLILDHHLSKEDWNSDRTVFLKCQDGYCAGYLCYELFSKAKDLSMLDWLVACSCVSDYCHLKTEEWLTQVYSRYEDSFEKVGTYVRKSGQMWDLQEALSLAIIYFKNDLNEVFDRIGERYGDIGDLKDYADKVRGEVQRLVDLFEKDRVSFKDGYLFEFTPKFACGSMVSTILSGQDIHKTILTLRKDPHADIYHVSARRQDKKLNMADFLKQLVHGLDRGDAGGHVPAAGGSFGAMDIKEFKKRLGVKA